MYKHHSLSAILLMGGSGSRFESDIPKQFHKISGKKVYLHTLELFDQSKLFDEILLVCHKDWKEMVQEEISEFSHVRVVEGGVTRQESSYLGLKHCHYHDIVMIHDAVRPFVTYDILVDNIEKAILFGAVDTCLPSTDTIVHSQDKEKISSIPIREQFLRGQTPQTFNYSILKKAHKKALEEKLPNVSDDCKLVLNLPHDVAIVLGSEENRKITSPLDLFLAEQIFRTRRQKHPITSESVEGKVFAIIGGTGGVGSSLCDLLKEEKALPLVLARNGDFKIDLTKPKSIENAFNMIFERYGEIDGIIHSAGSLFVKPLEELSLQEIEEQIETNLTGLIYTCKVAKIKKGGSIVNIASSSFSRGRKNMSVYSCTKAAVVNFTQGFAEERPDLLVNAVIPQRINTPMRRKNFPEENLTTLLNPVTVAKTILSILKDKTLTGTLVEVRIET